MRKIFKNFSDKIFIIIVFLTIISAIFIFGIFTYNTVFSNDVGEGKEYVYSWVSCEEFAGGKVPICLKKSTHQETRIPIYKSGPFWDYETYKVKH